MTAVSIESSQNDYKEYLENLDYVLDLLNENLSPTLLGIMKADWDKGKNRYKYRPANNDQLEATRILNYKVLFNTLLHTKEVVTDLYNGKNKVAFMGKAVFLDVSEFYHDFNRLQIKGEASIIKTFLEKNIDDIQATVDGLAPNLHHDMGLNFEEGQEMTTHTESPSDVVNTIQDIRDYIVDNTKLKIGSPKHGGYYDLPKKALKTENEKAVASQQALLNMLDRFGHLIDIGQSENSKYPFGKLGKMVAILGILISLKHDNEHLDTDALESTLKNAKAHFMNQVRSLVDCLAVEVDKFEMEMCWKPNSIQQFVTPFVEVFDRLDTEQSILRHDWLRAKNRQNIIDSSNAEIEDLSSRLSVIDKLPRMQKAFELDSLNNIPDEIYLSIATALGLKGVTQEEALSKILKLCSTQLQEKAQIHLAKNLSEVDSGFFSELWADAKITVNQFRNKVGDYGSTPVAFWNEVAAMLAVKKQEYLADREHIELMKVMALEQRTMKDVQLLADHPTEPEADHKFYDPEAESTSPIVVNEESNADQTDKKPSAFVKFWINVGQALKTFFQTIGKAIQKFFQVIGKGIAKLFTKKDSSTSQQVQTSESTSAETPVQGTGHVKMLKMIPVGKNNPLQQEDWDSESSASVEGDASSYEPIFKAPVEKPTLPEVHNPRHAMIRV